MVCMVWYGRLWFVSVYGWVIVCTHVCVLCVCVWVIVCVCALASGHASPTPSKPKACWTAGNNCGHVAPFARKTVPYLIACLLTYLLTYLYTYLLACLLADFLQFSEVTSFGWNCESTLCQKWPRCMLSWNPHHRLLQNFDLKVKFGATGAEEIQGPGSGWILDTIIWEYHTHPYM